MPRPWTRSATAVLAATALAACGGESSGPESVADSYKRVAGSYGLMSVDDKPLPASMSADPNFPVVVSGGELVLRENFTYVETVVFGSVGGGLPQTINGHYVLTGRAVDFNIPGSSITYPGTVDGGAVILTRDKHRYRYER